jgi:hypothetical protein
VQPQSGGFCSAGFATGAPSCSALRTRGSDPGHCSVFDASHTVCSAGGGFAKICSALCDDDATCSVAPAETAVGNNSYCSTFGSERGSAACSVFPFPGSGDGESICSTGGDFTTCSTRGGGNIQVCSAFQGSRAQYRNFCSAVNGDIDVTSGGSSCSVLSEGLPRKGACSTFIKAPVSKFCSAAGEYGSCSVLELGQGRYTGKCTALQWAEVNSCSTFAPPRRATGSPLTCSVLNIPQAAGNGRPGSCGRATNEPSPDCIGCVSN